MRDTNHEIRDTRDEPRDTTFLEFTVADTGIGIAAERIPVIFDLFQPADSSCTREYEGLGLGRCVAKEGGELLDGSLQGEGAPGQGWVFPVVKPFGRARGGRA